MSSLRDTNSKIRGHYYFADISNINDLDLDLDNLLVYERLHQNSFKF